MKKKKIGKEIDLKIRITRIGDTLICPGTRTLYSVLGMSSMDYGMLSKYGIPKKNDGYHVPISAVKDRIKTLNERKKLLEQYLEVMHQVVQG